MNFAVCVRQIDYEGGKLPCAFKQRGLRCSYLRSRSGIFILCVGEETICGCLRKGQRVRCEELRYG